MLLTACQLRVNSIFPLLAAIIVVYVFPCQTILSLTKIKSHMSILKKKRNNANEKRNLSTLHWWRVSLFCSIRYMCVNRNKCGKKIINFFSSQVERFNRPDSIVFADSLFLLNIRCSVDFVCIFLFQDFKLNGSHCFDDVLT